jgi:transposase-like protein
MRQSQAFHREKSDDKAFKFETVRRVSQAGKTQAGIKRDLDIGQGAVSQWKRGLLNKGKGNQNNAHSDGCCGKRCIEWRQGRRHR